MRATPLGMRLFARPTVVAVASPETLNPSDKTASITLSNGNLTAQAGGAIGGVRGVRTITSKAYWEFRIDIEASDIVSAIVSASADLSSALWWQTASAQTFSWGDGYGRYNTTAISYGATGLTQGWAYDPATKLAWLRDNTGWLNGDPVAGTGGMDISGMTGAVYPAFQGTSTDKGTFNFGATAYVFTPPTGYGNI